MRTYETTISSTLVRENKTAGWPHYEWRVTLTRRGETRVLPFKMGLGHIATRCGKPLPHTKYPVIPCHHVRCRECGPVPAKPTLYDVLTALKADCTHGETFGDWCASYGYDPDSRKAVDLYLACQESERESVQFFGEDWPRILEDEDYA